MRKFAFIGRHEMTAEQRILAEKAGIELAPFGDIDAFTGEMPSHKDYDGIVCAHAAFACRAIYAMLEVGVFENAQRPGLDGKMSFFAKSLTIYPFSEAPRRFDFFKEARRLQEPPNEQIYRVVVDGPHHMMVAVFRDHDRRSYHWIREGGPVGGASVAMLEGAPITNTWREGGLQPDLTEEADEDLCRELFGVGFVPGTWTSMV